jgi:AraC-like DNA-binding protein
MFCIRCKMAVEAALKAAKISYESVELGRATLESPLTVEQRSELVKELAHYQLELMEDRAKILVERIKTEIISLLAAAHPLQLKLSVHLSQVLDYNYTYLANVFSEEEGTTLEKYFISQRVERVKELMVYEELSLGNITDRLNFSSVSHLCLQFKKVTGLTPAEFKKRCRSDDFVWRPV